MIRARARHILSDWQSRAPKCQRWAILELGIVPWLPVQPHLGVDHKRR
jgi:hypothetical protein